MSEENARLLALLEVAHEEAKHAAAALREQWKREDAATAETRKALLHAHEQGARDRDAMRVALGGTSLIEAEARASQEAAEARLKAADEAAAKLKPDAKPAAKA